MAPPDVLKCRTQAFFLFSPGKGESTFGSDLLSFRSLKKKKNLRQEKFCWASPHCGFINVETRKPGLRDFFLNSLHLTHPNPSRSLSEFCYDFEARNWACKVLLSPVRLKGGHFASPLLSQVGPWVGGIRIRSPSQGSGWPCHQWGVVSAPLLKQPSWALSFSCKGRAWFLHPPPSPSLKENKTARKVEGQAVLSVSGPCSHLLCFWHEEPGKCW